jgi:hypothetical protein
MAGSYERSISDGPCAEDRCAKLPAKGESPVQEIIFAISAMKFAFTLNLRFKQIGLC